MIEDRPSRFRSHRGGDKGPEDPQMEAQELGLPEGILEEEPEVKGWNDLGQLIRAHEQYTTRRAVCGN